MEFFNSLVLLLTAVTVVSCQLLSDQEDKIFSEYLKNFKIRLGRSDIEESKRIFIDRYNTIEEHNQRFRDGETSYELGLDENSYLSIEELEEQRTGLLPRPDNFTDGSLPADQDTRRFGRAAPGNWDWRSQKGVVRPVQNQAFSGIGAIEGQLSRVKNRHDKLSEQEIIECVRDPRTNALRGCNGGWETSVFDHAKAKNGVATQSSRPYRGNHNTGCNTGTPRVPGSRTTTYYRITSRNEAEIKERLYSVGPLTVSLYASNDLYSYKSGVYTDSRGYCRNQRNNHAVLLVGYGSQNGMDYWLIKNSWGTGWGEAGYLKLQRGRNLCGIANDISYPKLA